MCQYEYCILFLALFVLDSFSGCVFDFISKWKTFVFSIDKRHWLIYMLSRIYIEANSLQRKISGMDWVHLPCVQGTGDPWWKCIWLEWLGPGTGQKKEEKQDTRGLDPEQQEHQKLAFLVWIQGLLQNWRLCIKFSWAQIWAM